MTTLDYSIEISLYMKSTSSVFLSRPLQLCPQVWLRANTWTPLFNQYILTLSSLSETLATGLKPREPRGCLLYDSPQDYDSDGGSNSPHCQHYPCPFLSLIWPSPSCPIVTRMLGLGGHLTSLSGTNAVSTLTSNDCFSLGDTISSTTGNWGSTQSARLATSSKDNMLVIFAM